METQTPTRKWTSTAGPIQTKRVNEAMKKLSWERRSYTEKSGILGGEERSHSYTSLGGPSAPRPEIDEALLKIGERFNYTVTRENYKDIVAALETALEHAQAARPVIDKRITPEQDAQQKAEWASAREREAEAQRARERAFDTHFGQPEAPAIAVPPGMTPIVLSLCFNNSDIRSDYFDPHHTVGHRLLLALVPKGARTQSLARAVLARYPELAARTWTWEQSHTYGHFLLSKGVPVPEGLATSHGSPVTTGHWKIDLGTYEKELRPHRDYRPDTTPLPATGTNGEVRLNSARNGVEIHFAAKPEPEVINEIKAHGFRWAMTSRCWYKRQSPDAIAFAYRITGTTPA